MISASTQLCLLCNNITQPQKRAYLKNVSEEPLLSLKNLLLRYHPEEKVKKCLESNQVVCKGRCQLMIRKMSKIKMELESIENEIVEKMAVKFPSDAESATCLETVQTLELLPSTPVRPQRRPRVEVCTPIRDILSRTVAPETPSVSVLCKKGERHKVYRLTHSLRSLGRSVGRRRKGSIVNKVMKDVNMRHMVVLKVCKMVKREVEYTCTREAGSMYAIKELKELSSFEWKTLSSDMKRTMPTLFQILQVCAKGNDELKNSIVTAFIGGIIIKQHNERMSFLQRLFSILLYSSHSPKQLYSRLQKVGVCMSHKSTIRYIDKLGLHFDDQVIEWRKQISEVLWITGKHVVPNTTLTEEIVNSQDLETNDFSEDTRSSDTETSSLLEFNNILELATITSDSSLDNAETEYDTQYSEYATNGIDEGISIVANESTMTRSIDQETETATLVDAINNNNNDSSVKVTTDKAPFPSFKIVGDNIDKSVKPRHETSEHHTRSLHYFHSYAVKDRIDVSALDDNAQLPDLDCIDVGDVLPSDDDVSILKENMTVIAGRIIRKHCKFLKENLKPVTPHIIHPFSKQMTKRSEVIPLGVLLKNEVKNNDMADILSHLQQYIPMKSTEEEIVDPDDDEVVKITVDDFYYTLFGGDQLTAERATGAKRSLSNENRGRNRLDGLVPVIEDWHSKVCLLKSIWKMLYKTSSGINSGTLFQLRNLLQRRGVTKEVKSDPTVCEDFFILVVKGHLLHLALEKFQLDSLDAIPPNDSLFGTTFLASDNTQRSSTFITAVGKIINEYTHDFQIGQYERDLKSSDRVLAYAKELLTLGLLFMEYIDAIHEGDGLRILRCWRFMLLIYKATGKRKYAIQAGTLLLQYHYLFTERMQNQLLWSRTVNTHGLRGKNIPMDLHMEHLNRELKCAIAHLGSNVAGQTIQRVGLCLRYLLDIKNNFDRSSGLSVDSGWHTSRSLVKDLDTVITELKKKEVFDNKPKRKHSEFKTFKCNVAGSIEKEELQDWLKDLLYKLINR